MSLRECPVNIPKSGKKLINIGGIDFFVREAKGIIEVYLVDSRECILVSANSRTKALMQLTERIQLVREYIEGRGTATL